MNHRDAKFKALQAKWYERLKQAGFEDVEITTTRLDYRNAIYRDRMAVSDYYSAAADFLHQGEFDTARERDIWALHTDGLSHREIVRALHCTRWAVEAVLAKYRPKAGLKPRQRPVN